MLDKDNNRAVVFCWCVRGRRPIDAEAPQFTAIV